MHRSRLSKFQVLRGFSLNSVLQRRAMQDNLLLLLLLLVERCETARHCPDSSPSAIMLFTANETTSVSHDLLAGRLQLPIVVGGCSRSSVGRRYSASSPFARMAAWS